MKKSRTRQRSHRTSTPSVICLPPPKPQTVAPRREPEVERAIGLPKTSEPLVTPGSRQARRKAGRAQAKASRSPAGAEPNAAAKAPEPLDDVTPLPRHRSLARQPSGLIERVGAWFSRLIPRPSTAPRVSQEALTEQMIALRSELAMVQGRLDRMIKATSRQ